MIINFFYEETLFMKEGLVLVPGERLAPAAEQVRYGVKTLIDILCGRGETRTLMLLPALDFESNVSTIPPPGQIVFNQIIVIEAKSRRAGVPCVYHSTTRPINFHRTRVPAPAKALAAEGLPFHLPARSFSGGGPSRLSDS